MDSLRGRRGECALLLSAICPCPASAVGGRLHPNLGSAKGTRPPLSAVCPRPASDVDGRLGGQRRECALPLAWHRTAGRLRQTGGNLGTASSLSGSAVRPLALAARPCLFGGRPHQTGGQRGDRTLPLGRPSAGSGGAPLPLRCAAASVRLRVNVGNAPSLSRPSVRWVCLLRCPTPDGRLHQPRGAAWVTCSLSLSLSRPSVRRAWWRAPLHAAATAGRPLSSAWGAAWVTRSLSLGRPSDGPGGVLCFLPRPPPDGQLD